jgi:hypothetical protein
MPTFSANEAASAVVAEHVERRNGSESMIEDEGTLEQLLSDKLLVQESGLSEEERSGREAEEESTMKVLHNDNSSDVGYCVESGNDVIGSSSSSAMHSYNGEVPQLSPSKSSSSSFSSSNNTSNNSLVHHHQQQQQQHPSNDSSAPPSSGLSRQLSVPVSASDDDESENDDDGSTRTTTTTATTIASAAVQQDILSSR